tara:strand:- start:258 stop:455 length:198 start_codon:yes stop_codon:yes gene_type:complete
MKKVTINLTYSWTIDSSEWRENKEFMKKIEENPRITLGEDLKSTFWNLNDITHPELKNIEVKNAE